jgi:hypothetical protein
MYTVRGKKPKSKDMECFERIKIRVSIKIKGRKGRGKDG